MPDAFLLPPVGNKIEFGTYTGNGSSQVISTLSPIQAVLVWAAGAEISTPGNRGGAWTMAMALKDHPGYVQDIHYGSGVSDPVLTISGSSFTVTSADGCYLTDSGREYLYIVFH